MPLQEGSSFHHTISCRQTGPCALRTRVLPSKLVPCTWVHTDTHASPPYTGASSPKGMNGSMTNFPNHTECRRDTGNTGGNSPEHQLHHTPRNKLKSDTALLHYAFPDSATHRARKKKKKNQTQQTILEKFFSITCFPPVDPGFTC